MGVQRTDIFIPCHIDSFIRNSPTKIYHGYRHNHNCKTCFGLSSKHPYSLSFITTSRILIQTRSCIQYTTGNEPHNNCFLLLTLSSCNVSPPGIYSITIFRHVWGLKLSWQVYNYIHTLELEVVPKHHCTFLCARGKHRLTNKDCLYMDDKDNE